ncbi:4Fe-4S single cluster domain-containing protein [Campylobacter sp. RM16190]|uniref:4Fe-4S single cluster domain-containing protein n=1 Tax=Campylobacter sp. RM16190 TaxID=1705727 RepID=UPI001474EEFD|nr:4Fe-4S single cluster domain-containing protein [Campylobacter sp. RM16190]
MLNIASIRECTIAEGPGKRMAIWTQGCLKRCKNCCNPHMQALKKREFIQTHNLIEKIEKSRKVNGIEGVTLLGGEPIIQSKGLSKVAKWCKQNNLSVLLFSGYTLQEMQLMNTEGLAELLEYTDVLIDGEYIDDLYNEDYGIVGSSNQKIHFLTNFYTLSDFKNEIKVDIIIEKDNISMNGWVINL